MYPLKPCIGILMISADHSLFSIEEGNLLRSSDPPQLQEEQFRRLLQHLQHAKNSRYYSRIFKDKNIILEDLRSVKDLRSLPFTDRVDLGRYNDEFIADNISIRDISHTSGTTGEPVVVPYTAHDLKRLAFNEAIAFYGAGLRAEDRILLTVTLDRCFIAGLAYYTGAIFLGASAIRSGPGQPAQQWNCITKFKPTVLLGVPSFLLALARWGTANGYDCRKTSITSIVTIGEPIRNGDLELTSLGKLLHEKWGVPIYSSYGATEIETAFGDCCHCRGGHVHPELMIVEIIDNEGNILPDNSAGEVVVTPLGVEGLPLVRFKTGDIARLHTKPCPCGWKTSRLGPIEGRLSQRLKYKGTTLYPEMIFEALQQLPTIDDSYIEIRQSFDLADEITVVIGTNDTSINVVTIRNLLLSNLRVTPEVILKKSAEVSEKTGKGKLRKPQRFFDHR